MTRKLPADMDTTETSAFGLKAFVPSKDLAISQQFYIDLGFTQKWTDSQMAEFQIGSFCFLLQAFYVPQHAENFMMQLTVKDADVWWKHIKSIGLQEKYPDIIAKAPETQPWGPRVLYLTDPTGVLWHITERPAV